MGLDAVEIVTKAEEAFGVYLSDEECSNVKTVGEFHQLILRHLAAQSPRRCATAMAFYRLRRAIVQVTQADRREIRPDTPLDQVLPPNRRRRVWPMLAKTSGMCMPRLHRPGFVTSAIRKTIGAAFVAGVVLHVLKVAPIWTFWAAGAALAVSAALATRPLAVHLAAGGAAVGDLARAVFQRNIGYFARQSGGLDRVEVWHAVIGLVAEQFGVDVRTLTAETRFVEDLNA